MSDDSLEQQINKALKQAVAFHQAGQLQQAGSMYRQLLRVNPNQPEILHLLGLVSYQMGSYGEAVALIGRAVELHPGMANYHNHLGSALFALGKKDVALMQFRKAAECTEPTVDVVHNLGVALYDNGEWEESIQVYESGLKKYQNDGVLLNEVIKNMSDACMWGESFEQYKAQLLEQARKAVTYGKPTTLTPYQSLCLSDDAKLQHSLAKQHAEQIESRTKPAKQQLGFLFEKGHKPSGHHHALRIGYVSADFRDHPTAHLIGNMLELHDKEQVEVFVYALGEGDESSYRNRIKQACSRFVDVHNVPLHQLAQQIYQDKIDILIDVMGYISGARPDVFAMRPAPLNISFLAYPGTMGAAFIDYLVTDKIALSDARQVSETPFYMPHSYFVSDPTLKVHKQKSRTAYGLPEKGLVLGCFNKPSKITPQLFKVWCDLLKEQPEAVLWLYAPNDFIKQNLTKAAKLHEIEAERLVFAKRLDKSAHLARYSHMDVFLDCAPVTAHTTAIDALLMGVPVVTIQGSTIISRASASILSAAGLQELICEDISSYHAKLSSLLSDDASLRQLKNKAAACAKNSPLFDTKSYTRHFEAGLHQAFNRWLEGEKPTSVYA